MYPFISELNKNEDAIFSFVFTDGSRVLLITETEMLGDDKLSNLNENIF